MVTCLNLNNALKSIHKLVLRMIYNDYNLYFDVVLEKIQVKKTYIKYIE